MDLWATWGCPKEILSLSVISHGNEVLGWVAKLRSLHMQGWRGTSSRDFPATLCLAHREKRQELEAGRIFPVYWELPWP